MNQKNIAITILNDLKEELSDSNLKKKYYSNTPELFSRKRKLGLSGIIAFLLKKSLKSYELRLEELQERFQIWEKELPTKQAVSKARAKVDWKIFADLFSSATQRYLENSSDFPLWNGYHIYAIDGSDCEVPTTKATLDYFGDTSSGKALRNAGATTSTLTDVRNGFILDAEIAPYKTGERTLALQHCEKIKSYLSTKNSIFLCDRGYPSYDFLGYFHDNGLNYVMRVKESFRRMRVPGRREGEVYLKLRGRMRTVRTIELRLENGKKEYLITNLLPSEMPWEKFQELYFLRWSIEGKYQEIKSRLKIEEFSGKTINNIKQDYYACLLLSNISALVKNAADDEIKRKEGKNYKKYQANRNYVTGCMNSLLELHLRVKTKIEQKVEQLIEKAERKRSLIRPNRKNERNKYLSRRRHHINYKPCI